MNVGSRLRSASLMDEILRRSNMKKPPGLNWSGRSALRRASYRVDGLIGCIRGMRQLAGDRRSPSLLRRRVSKDRKLADYYA